LCSGTEVRWRKHTCPSASIHLSSTSPCSIHAPLHDKHGYNTAYPCTMLEGLLSSSSLGTRQQPSPGCTRQAGPWKTWCFLAPRSSRHAGSCTQCRGPRFRTTLGGGCEDRARRCSTTACPAMSAPPSHNHASTVRTHRA